jgi:tRNA pseudouridine(55) synthase
MITVTKTSGETMDQLINRIKKEYNYNKIAYTARLDPMARGLVPLLIDDECKNIKSHLIKSKIYQVKIIFGVQTDSDDPLGIITKKLLIDNLIQNNYTDYFELINYEFQQNYHYFSTKMLNHRLKKNFTEASHKVTIYKSEIIDSGILEYNKWLTKIINKINSIDKTKNFRQEETIKQWTELNINKLPYIKLRLHVSSGFFIRQFVRDASIKIGIPLMAYDIHRIKVL